MFGKIVRICKGQTQCADLTVRERDAEDGRVMQF